MKVLICIDHSSASEFILRESQKFLTSFPAAEIHIHYVQEVVLYSEFPAMNKTVGHIMEEEINSLTEKAKGMFPSSVQVSSSIGIPADNIIDEVKKLNCDLLVLGTHGRTGFKRAILGSVAEKVIRHVDCKTLVIPVRSL